ncbi:DUF3769 domain-containing protein [Leptolyngbya sp. FACHB-36]|uniref:DUF3769 domain-containing protein n=1 Tax=Leptolyngbya sp. FACHB-36 TaxID=2692808 RepID=UPI0016805EA4|nr:DUF3769 domain-containing protein [Leptolyngbya sp. FACHB-36]MBD2020051.1 DUF3769 domain-containing protein [Leptolyngbya sp. FACHB-36]
MPYLAPPPDHPASIATPVCQQTDCHSLTVASEPDSAQAIPTRALARPTPPEIFAPERSPAQVTVGDFSQQQGESSAALLNKAVDEPIDPAQLFRVESLDQPPDRPAPVTYSLKARSGNLPQGQEETVLKGLDQTMELLDGLRGTPTTLSATRRRLPASVVGQVQSTPDRLVVPLGQPAPLPDSPPLSPTLPSSTPAPIPTTPSSSPPSPGTPSPSAPSPGTPGSSTPGSNTPSPILTLPPGAVGLVELTADRQEYDQNRRIFTAEGRVLMRFQGTLLDADRLQVNLLNRNAVAEGNVALTRGSQVLRGQRLDFNFVQGSGTVFAARGDIFLPSTSSDFGAPLQNDAAAGTALPRPVSDRVTAAQPTQNVTNPGGFSTGIGLGRDIRRIAGALPIGGAVRRLRFEAERLDFTPDGWEAQNIQITNDPYSPPQLVLKAPRAKLTRLSPLRDELRATRPRLVFDQRVAIPLISRVVFDRRQRPPALVRIGFDDGERGGLFVERTFEPIRTETVRLSLTPQVYVQQGIFNSGGPFDGSNYGLKGDVDINLGPRTSIRGSAVLTSLDFREVEDKLRASLRARQLVGTHTLALEYSYRDRLFNNSLGFQDVQSSLGALLFSPVTRLGSTGIDLSYQAGFQNISANTDRPDLLAPVRDNDRINLSRFQAVAAISRGFTLWQGQPAPATPEEGLRYSPIPVTPYVGLGVGLTGVFGAYSNGDTQQDLIASVGLSAQFGKFARPYLDYTAFNISYRQLIGSGASPFLFDRTVDDRILSVGITQQVYGPLRVGFQTSFNLDNSRSISTDYIVEYSRRAYGIVIRYNPVLSIGAIGLRISDFNWTGGSEPFDSTDVTPVEGGVIRRRE